MSEIYINFVVLKDRINFIFGIYKQVLNPQNKQKHVHEQG